MKVEMRWEYVNGCIQYTYIQKLCFMVQFTNSAMQQHGYEI
jgi:hypothetical protein